MNASSRSRGFTVVELLVVVVFLAVAAVFLLIQRNDLQATQHDTQRKTAINAFYYSLEKVYYPAHHSYPQTISTGVLPSVDPALFTDPDGHKQGAAGYEYTYEPTGCSNNACKNYTLSAALQKEAAYTKKSDR